MANNKNTGENNPKNIILVIVITIVLLALINPVKPSMLLTMPKNTYISMSVDIWQELDTFLDGSKKQERINPFRKILDWVKGREKKIGLFNKDKEKSFKEDDSEWDKTYKTVKRIEEDAFLKAFNLAKEKVVLKAIEDGLDEKLTREASESKINPNLDVNFYYLYCVIDTYLLNCLDDLSLDNYDPLDEKSIENCIINAPFLEKLCPFTLEKKSKIIKEGEIEKELFYYDPTFYPYTKKSCFDALDFGKDDSCVGYEKMTNYEVADMYFFMAKIQDENVTVKMNPDKEVEEDYFYSKDEYFLRSDEEGNEYRYLVPENIVTYKNAEEFIEKMGPIIQKLCEERGWSCAPYMIAQMGIETGWGKSLLSSAYFNYGGQKAGKDYTGDYVIMKTWEVIDGKNVRVDAKFRAYKSEEEGIRAYLDFFEHSSYFSGVKNAKSANEFANILVGGKTKYATDPNYAKKLVNTSYSYDLERYNAQP